MRADRLLSIILLLQAHQRMTAGELARRLEVSERTIYRDMDALSMAGIPVVAERGASGGWTLLDTYKANLSGLNVLMQSISPAELQTLFLNAPARALDDLGLQRASEAAALKLLGALPAVSRRNVEYIRQRIYVDATGWRAFNEDISALPTLQEALWQERKLIIRYQRGDQTLVERLIDPLGLVAKGSVWYLVAGVDSEIRTYRVSRLREVRLADQPSVRLPDFDLAAYWEQSAAEFKANLPRYPTLLRAAPEILARLPLMWRFAQIERVDPPDADGWSKAAVLFELEEEACLYVLSFGPHIEVLEPPALRDRVIAVAQLIVAFYAEHVQG
jgi:predicted DNA-binding transcriptional regulator YafY